MIEQILNEIKSHADEQTYRIYENHGSSTHFGVKLSTIKTIAKRERNLSLEEIKKIYLSGILEAQHLAQYILARSRRHHELTNKDFESFLDVSINQMSREYILAEIMGIHNDLSVIKEWLKDLKDVPKASVGLSAISVYIRNNRNTNDSIIDKLLDEARWNINDYPDRIKYTLNGFVISVGTYIEHKHLDAIVVAKTIGHISVDSGKTSCKVPYAYEYLQRAHDRVINQKENKFWHGCM